MTRLAARHRPLVALVALLPAWLACADAPTGVAPRSPTAQSAADRRAEPLAAIMWQTRARQLVPTIPLNPNAAARAYALVGVAQYGAIVDADFGGGQAQHEARRGAIAGASAQVLSYLFPAAASSLEQMVIDDGTASSGVTHPQYTRGVEAGRAMGDVMKAWAAADGFAKPWDGVPLPTGPGMWRQAPNVAPVGFQFPTMTPYFLTSASQFRPEPPPPFGSAAFLAELAATRLATTTRGPAEVALANFWNQSTGTQTTAGHWVDLAGQYATADGLDERATARLFALIGTSLVDASIGCFEAKYHYLYIRPSQADPLITRPAGPPGFPYNLPNHPAYPSGHSCLSAAAATIVADHFPAATATLDQLVADAGRSRIVGGIHYPIDVSAGQALGRAVALNTLAYDRRHGLLAAVARD